jgi:hypothetical protein
MARVGVRGKHPLKPADEARFPQADPVARGGPARLRKDEIGKSRNRKTPTAPRSFQTGARRRIHRGIQDSECSQRPQPRLPRSALRLSPFPFRLSSPFGVAAFRFLRDLLFNGLGALNPAVESRRSGRPSDHPTIWSASRLALRPSRSALRLSPFAFRLLPFAFLSRSGRPSDHPTIRSSARLRRAQGIRSVRPTTRLLLSPNTSRLAARMSRQRLGVP